MKKKIIVFFSVVALVIVSSLSFFKVGAVNRNYELRVDTEDNFLIYVFGDLHGTYDYPLIATDTYKIVDRNGNYYYFDQNYEEEYSILNLYAFNIRYVNVGVDDYELYVDIYYLNPTNFEETNAFILLDNLTIQTQEMLVPEISLYIDFEYVIEIQNFAGISFSVNENTVYSYLKGNSMNPSASTLGQLIESVKHNNYEKGFNDGINTQFTEQNWWVELWNGVDAFLSIELLPNLTFGLLFSVPLVFGVLHLILFIWRSGD